MFQLLFWLFAFFFLILVEKGLFIEKHCFLIIDDRSTFVSCNYEMINSLDVDRSGEADNEQKLKNIMMLFIGGIVALIALIVLVIVFFSGIGSKNDVAVGDGKINDAPSAATAVGSFKPESVEALLPKPVMTLPQLPVAQ